VATFILVHGSFHGAWCWQHLKPRLTAKGHRVLAPDLPASGADLTPLEQADLTRYAECIGALVAAESEQPILVGHSMGAIVCAQVAEAHASRLAGWVAICGLLLRSGETLNAFLAEFAHLGVEDQVLAHMQLSPDGGEARFPAEAAAEVFYHRCCAKDAQWAAARLGPQATAVYGDLTALSDAAYGRVRRFYVQAGDDRAVSPTYQSLMVERSPCEAIYTLDTDHSPFLSAPQALADVLQDVATRLTAPC
jgi:pimeloyl-ACP methyl ester carboxylesterase